MNYEELWKIMSKHPVQRDILWRMCILIYELGDTVKAVIYKRYYGDTGVHAELKIALADLIAQIHILCLQANLDFKELEELGLKRLGEFVTGRM